MGIPKTSKFINVIRGELNSAIFGDWEFTGESLKCGWRKFVVKTKEIKIFERVHGGYVAVK